MSWNDCLYRYHKGYGGQFLAGEEDDGLLLLTWRDQPLAVDLSAVSAGRGGTANYIQARIPVTLAKPYSAAIGAESRLSGGVNTVLKAASGVPGLPSLPADFGFPEVTQKRLIRTDNAPFTKLVLGSLDFRNALLACPRDRIAVRPGPGKDGLHLITVTTAPHTYSQNNDWYLGDILPVTEEEKAQEAVRIETEFFPRMDRFLALARTAYDAVTQWPM